VNSTEKKEFQKNLKFIADVKVQTVDTNQFQNVMGKGDGQLDRLCTEVFEAEKGLVKSQRALVDYAKSRLEK
jgi:hypothetical protein